MAVDKKASVAAPSSVVVLIVGDFNTHAPGEDSVKVNGPNLRANARGAQTPQSVSGWDRALAEFMELQQPCAAFSPASGRLDRWYMSLSSCCYSQFDLQ
eukprot:6639770-Karenia_brevis.AAC.1